MAKRGVPIIEKLGVGEVASGLTSFVETSSGDIQVKTPSGVQAIVHAANINTVLAAAGGAGWGKVQAAAPNYTITKPASGAGLDLHIESGGSLAALTSIAWPVPATGVDQLRIRNFSGSAKTFTAGVGWTIVTADGNPITGGSYSIPDDRAVEITLDPDGFAQVVPWGGEVSEAVFNVHTGNVANPHVVTAAQVGLGNVTNTSDANKPVSTAQQTALNLKQDASTAATDAELTAHTGSTSNPHNVTKAQIGLANAENTNDALKVVSIATQAALDAKQATLVSGTTIKTINGVALPGSGNIVIAPTTVSSTVPTHNLDLVSDNYAGRALHFRPNGMTATANLATWSDSSGNGRDATQATAANQPDVVENVVNGLPVVDFDGVDDHMNTSSSLNLNTSTIFTVIRPTASAAGKTILGATSPGPEWKLGPLLVPSIDLSGVGVLVNGTTALIVDQWTLLVFKKTGVINTNEIYINGTADTMATNAAGVIGAYTPRIAATHGISSSTCFNGDIAEIVAFPTVLSTIERQKVEGYLAHKYALTASLDAGHPYKTNAPQAGSLQVFADQAAAIAGSLTVGQVYVTSTGQLMAVY